MQKKLIFVTLAALLLSVQLGAQAKINSKVVTSNYNRNSVSVVNIQRGDSYDSATQSVVKAFNPGSKFDINTIRTNYLRIRGDRKEALSRSSVAEAVEATPFAREILGSIFNRDSQGMMDDKTVRYRGNYDAKDQDVINARASRVGEEALGDLGHALVKGSYVILTDFYKFDSNTSRDGKVTYSANAKAYAYKIGMDDNTLNDFYEQCWIYPEDDQATRDAKNKAFRNLQIPMEYVASASSSGSGGSYEVAAASCLRGLITGLENAIPEWEVASGIIATKPLRAKIGTKEGLTRGARYRSYSYTEDNNGNLKSVPRGFLRATDVSDNQGMSIGATEPSSFYQISGLANIEEGWTLKQSNDVGIGVAPGLRLGAPGKTAIAFDFDYLMDVKTSGTMQYILATFGIDVTSGNVDYVPIFLTLGYGYAIHLTRLFELMPYAQFGIEHIGYSSTDKSSDRFMRESALLIEPGVRLAVNVAYPLQVYAKAFYDLNPEFIQGGLYKMYNSNLAVPHKSGLGLQAGVKWTF